MLSEVGLSGFFRLLAVAGVARSRRCSATNASSRPGFSRALYPLFFRVHASHNPAPSSARRQTSRIALALLIRIEHTADRVVGLGINAIVGSSTRDPSANGQK